MKKRLTAILLAMLMVMPLAACSDNASDSESSSSVDEETASTVENAADTTETQSEEDAELDALYADVPSEDYNGYEFVFLNNISNFAYTFMTTEELTGDVLNDAVYNRNIKVSEKLGIVITENLVDYGDVTDAMNKEIAANTDTYDCFWNESKFVAPFATKGSLVNVNDIESLNLDKPWWNSGAMNDVEVKDKLYFLVGDLHLMFKEAHWLLGFNKNIMDSVNLSAPYDLVREGKWTYDALNQYLTAAVSDLNGNGEVDIEDQFGLTSYDGCIRAFVYGTGETVMEKNSEGIPEFITPGDRFYSVYDDLVNMLFAVSDGRYCGNLSGLDTYGGWMGVFSQGHAMFFSDPVGSLKKLRDMDAEFGVVPYPKYDENQENYVSLIAVYAAFCGIPITNSDTERTGVILENLCAESYGGVRDAYSQATLNFKYIRDEDSSEMLDIVFNTGTFNLSDTLGVSVLTDTIQSNANNGKTDIASQYTKMMKSALKLLDKAIDGLLGEE